MAQFLFYLLAIVSVFAVSAMILSKNQAYSALYVILAFVCTGGLFALLGAPFIAVVQIIIYAGAIMILFVFVIMMVNIKEGLPPERKRWTFYLSALLGAVLLIELFLAVKAQMGAASTAAGLQTSPTDLGRLLFTEYLYPFEITSILIIAAIVGSIVLVKKREKE
jgi:NADH-quinone oxidoreductase subunit J